MDANKEKLSRLLRVLLGLGHDFTGITDVKFKWRDGEMTGGIKKNEEQELDWQKLSEIK